MEIISRKPFQGVKNILRFNWHFYALAVSILFLFGIVILYVSENLFTTALPIMLVACLSMIISLGVSYYIYDASGFYHLNWLRLELPKPAAVANIHAGFDETSDLLAQKFPDAALQVFDFYNPATHTEISIKRARKAYPAYPGTITIATTSFKPGPQPFDIFFCLLAAHEIRNHAERVTFFTQLREALKPGGKIIVAEHLRDLPNFLAYTIGVFHFHSRSSWQKTFQEAGLLVTEEQKHTPFLTIFTLSKNGNAP